MSGNASGERQPSPTVRFIGNSSTLERCRRLATRRLTSSIDGAVHAVVDELLKRADQCSGRKQQQLLDALTHLRVCGGSIAQAFANTYDSLFVDMVEAVPTKAPASPEAVRSARPKLALVSDFELDDTFILGTLTQKALVALDTHQIFEMRARIACLVGADIAEDSRNPLLPAAVFSAFDNACRIAIEASTERHAVLEGFAPFIITELAALYDEINSELSALAPLPQIARSEIFSSEQGRRMRTVKRTEQAESEAPATWRDTLRIAQGALTNELATALANVMAGPPAGRMVVAELLSDPDSLGYQEATRIPPTRALLESLDQWQSRAIEERGARAVVARLDQQAVGQSHPLDLLTIEFVSMIFERLIEDSSIPATVSEALARLQIVAIKAAMINRTFFADRAHPMRVLLDRIAIVGCEVDLDLKPDSPLIEGLRAIVQRLVHEFKDDLSIFTRALGEVDALVATARASVERRLDEYTSEVRRRENVELARMICAAEVARRLQPFVPDFLRRFLNTAWLEALVESHGREDASEDGYRKRLEAVDVLVWSVAPLSTAHVTQLAAVLQPTMRAVTRGMIAIGMPDAERVAFFQALMQVHLELIGRAKDRGRTGASTQAPERAAPTSADAPEPAANVDEFDRRVAALVPGRLLHLDGKYGNGRAVVAWISPSRRLLVLNSDRGGLNTIEAAALAEELRIGRAFVVSNARSPLDRAFDHIARGTSAHEPDSRTPFTPA